MSIEENKVIARRLLEEVFVKGNLSVADELIGSDYIYHGAVESEVKGAEGIKQTAALWGKAIPDRYGIFEDQIAEGDKVATRFTFGGTHTGDDFLGIAPTGKKFAISGVIISRIVNGKIVEEWETIDMLGLMQQLSVIPPVRGG